MLELVILPRARADLEWFRIYYRDYFPEGMAKASARFAKCAGLLCQNPEMGSIIGQRPRRKFSVPETPYTILYQSRKNRLEIVRVLDQRKETYLKELYDS